MKKLIAILSLVSIAYTVQAQQFSPEVQEEVIELIKTANSDQ